METRFPSCECEHAAHFPVDRKLTPNGNPGHKYGQKFGAFFVMPVKTTHGTFTVCQDCRDDCLVSVKL